MIVMGADRLMTIGELAEYLQVPRETIYRWRKTGAVRADSVWAATSGSAAARSKHGLKPGAIQRPGTDGPPIQTLTRPGTVRGS